MQSTKTLLNTCRAELVVTYDELQSEIQNTQLNPECKLITVESFENSEAGLDLLEPDCEPDDIAYLQFSSGTTGAKKGVEISHRALLWHVDHYAEAIELNQQDKIASWLPLYHDMGLVACCWLPFLTGTPLVAMSPFDWVKRPSLLFKAIEEYECTLSWLPNFAYNLLARSSPNGVDLRSLRGLINCSEPILHSSHSNFQTRFSSCGFEPKSFCASYAMAENTFAVTSGGFREPLLVETVDRLKLSGEGWAQLIDPREPNALSVVSSGTPLSDTQISIVKESGDPCDEGEVGIIEIKSPSLFKGYLGKGSALSSRGTFSTGDLGYLRGDHLFVLGRADDLIIVAGNNILPQDIETIINQVDGTIPGRNVAIGVDSEEAGTQQLVVLVETHLQDTAEREELKSELVSRIVSGSGVRPSDVYLVPHMWLRKSTSGKISRRINKERYSEKKLEHSPKIESHNSGGVLNEVRSVLDSVVKQYSAFPVSNVGYDSNLFEAGVLDSLNFSNFVSGLEAHFGIQFQPHTLTDPQNFSSLRKAALLVQGFNGQFKPVSAVEKQEAAVYGVAVEEAAREVLRHKAR